MLEDIEKSDQQTNNSILKILKKWFIEDLGKIITNYGIFRYEIYNLREFKHYNEKNENENHNDENRLAMKITKNIYLVGHQNELIKDWIFYVHYKDYKQNSEKYLEKYYKTLDGISIRGLYKRDYEVGYLVPQYYSVIKTRVKKPNWDMWSKQWVKYGSDVGDKTVHTGIYHTRQRVEYYINENQHKQKHRLYLIPYYLVALGGLVACDVYTLSRSDYNELMKFRVMCNYPLKSFTTERNIIG